MRNLRLIFLLCFFSSSFWAQQTIVSGTVTDAETGEPLPFVRVQFQNSKIGTMTDSVGNYRIQTYYATDSLTFLMVEYKYTVVAVKRDVEQAIDVKLKVPENDIEEVFVRPPDEFPSTILHKRMVANKPINDKEKLDSYGYEVYNKIQIDLNNIGDKFKERGVVKRLDVVMDYLDSADGGKTFLPVILSENISEFNYKNNPKKRKEVVSATRISGIENVQLNQFLGEMYLDFNIYDNYINLFQKAFISPTAGFARSFYKFYLDDSMFIDNSWCYRLTFKPKRTGDMTFEGEMWITDTTYAIKSIKANISPWANINYVQDLYLEHHFDQVQPEVWMLTEEKMIIDLKLTQGTDLYGFYGRKYSSRKNFVINKTEDPDFYKAENTVEFAEGSKTRDKAYWNEHRHKPLNEQEQGIDNMVDSLNADPFFKFLKNFTYMLTSGYYPLGKLELGSVHSLLAINTVEGTRTGLALRTSNEFSRTVEFGGKLYYGFLDERFKYGLLTRINLSKRKRALMSLYLSKDIEQLGLSPTAASVGSTFSSLLRTEPLNKLTFNEKIGISLEKDFGKDIVTFIGLEWREYSPLGITVYERYNTNGALERLPHIQTAEVKLRFRYCKNEEFISGAFDRASLISKHPIFTVQGIFGVKGIMGSDYDYQRIEGSYEHNRNIGVFGRIRYGVEGGVIFGKVAYPFLKVHEGSNSYWMYTNSFNRMGFFEFISDRYVGGFVEQHWQGLFFDRIPLIKKLKWRLVTSARATYGAVSAKHNEEMLLPTFTKRFGALPYAEASVGIENIFKFGRVDLVYRATYLDPGMNPFGIRVRWDLNF